MRVALSAFVLGVAAFAAVALLASFLATALADASDRRAYELGIAGVQLVTYERTSHGTSTEFGPGLAALPLAGGLANAAAAVALAAFRRKDS